MVPTLQKVPLKLKIVCKFCVSVSMMREFLHHHLSLSLVSLSLPPLGSVCTTRKKTGVGYPQLSAVMECADAAHGLRGHIISVSKPFHPCMHIIIISIFTLASAIAVVWGTFIV